MLIETEIKQNDVVTLKLVGGDEVVGRVVSPLPGNEIEISKPLLVMMSQQGFGLVPYVLTAAPDVKIKIDIKHIVVLTKTYDQVAKEYLKQTTGLIT